MGADPSFVGLDRSEKYLLSAFYQAGKVMVHRVSPDGALSAQAAADVMTAQTAHSTLLDPTNRFLFVPHVTPNAVFQFKFDAATGALTPHPMARAAGADGAGPRHIKLHSSGKWAYTSDESGSSISAWSFDPTAGTMTRTQTVSTLPAGFTTSNSTAEVKLHPNGRFAYVSNRGHDSIAAFAIDQGTGQLKALGQTPTEKTPRSFDIDASGKLLFAAGQGGTTVASYRLDANTGGLTKLETLEVGKQPFWILLVQQQ